MPQVSPVPYHYPTMPITVLNSLLPRFNDDLAEQRELARSIVLEADDIYRTYFKSGSHPSVTPDMARWAFNHTDYTTLRATRNEDAKFLRRMMEEANGPIKARAICFWNDLDKIKAVIEMLSEFPDFNFAVVTNFPHGHASPAEAARQIYKVREIIGDIPNKVDIDSVINGQAWIAGDEKRVIDVLKAEADAIQDCGFLWKSIQQITLHGRVADPFKSIYRSSMLAMERGADCIKTSTGLAAAPPDNDFVPVDTAYPANMLPMFLAIRDFNNANGTSRWPKISGGQRSEVDVAVDRLIAERTIGSDLLDSVVIGSGIRIRPRLYEYIAVAEGSDAAPGHDAFKLRYDIESLPFHARGLPDPREAPKINPAPPQSLPAFNL